MPDIFSAPSMNVVNQRFHDLVEQFEPGVHQFFPLKIFRSDGSPLDDDYYIFNCAVGLDAIIHSSADPAWANAADGTPILYVDFDKQFEISRPAIGDHHMWCGKSVAQRVLFVSDTFYQAIESNNIRWVDAVHRQELDMPWVAERELAPLMKWRAARH
jgi:uncharacterized protein DUF1629